MGPCVNTDIPAAQLRKQIVLVSDNLEARAKTQICLISLSRSLSLSPQNCGYMCVKQCPLLHDFEPQCLLYSIVCFPCYHALLMDWIRAGSVAVLTAVFVTMLICVSDSVMINQGPSGKISQSVFTEICQVSSANACHSLSILMQAQYLQQQ